MKFAAHIPSPLTKLEIEGREVYVKREDLIHPQISGNKFRKLKYNLIAAKQQSVSKIISFGGAYSNHIHALAVACRFYDLELLLYIRGEKVSNPTIDSVRRYGAKLVFVSRDEYREIKKQQNFPEFVDSMVIPEGGSNELAIAGIQEMMSEIDIPAAQYCVSYGSGATSLGMMSALSDSDTLHVFSALKFPSFEAEYSSSEKNLGLRRKSNVSLHSNYHFGGYAKWNEKLINFINDFPIHLDPIYTGKLFYGVTDLIKSNQLDSTRPIVVVHTGGLQGIAGFNARFGKIIET